MQMATTHMSLLTQLSEKKKKKKKKKIEELTAAILQLTEC